MLDFQRYQLAFTAHLRDPDLHPKPHNVVGKRIAVYRESVFNNLVESVSACFPVCQNVLGKRKWQRLIRLFFAQYSAESPFFREIPQQFLSFLNQLDLHDTALNLPPFIQQLAHYEWIELSISSRQSAQLATKELDADLNCLDNLVALAPVSELLIYDYPVHQISARFKPIKIEKNHFLVYRNSQFEVKFIVLNPVTFSLLSLIAQKPLTGRQALTKLADELQHPDIAVFIQFGADILNNLYQQQAISFQEKAATIQSNQLNQPFTIRI